VEMEAEKRRLNTSPDLKVNLLKNLQKMLHEENKYVREFESVSERMRDNYTNYNPSI